MRNGARPLSHSATAALASLLLAFCARGVHAQDLAAWEKDRDARFLAFQAAHPNQDAEIADIKAKTAALIAAYVPPPAPDKYADLKARSASLTPEQKAQAVGIFSTGFKLWQAGDYNPAKEAFGEGLAIDPANGLGNYYMGDILQRQNDPAARTFMDKALALAPGTPEAYKAKAALKLLPQPENSPELDLPSVIRDAGHTGQTIWDSAGAPEMVVVPSGQFTIGSTDKDRPDEQPRQRIDIQYSFAISKYPITVGEFSMFVAATNYAASQECHASDPRSGQLKTTNASWKANLLHQMPDSPVICLTIRDQMAYADWLTRMTGYKYRFVSEAEYEFASDGAVPDKDGNVKSTSKYGIDCDNCDPHGLSDVVFAASVPVTSFHANGYGLHAMNSEVIIHLADCLNGTDDVSYQLIPKDGSPFSRPGCSVYSTRGNNGTSSMGSKFRGSFDFIRVNADDITGLRLARQF